MTVSLSVDNVRTREHSQSAHKDGGIERAPLSSQCSRAHSAGKIELVTPVENHLGSLFFAFITSALVITWRLYSFVPCQKEIGVT